MTPPYVQKVLDRLPGVKKSGEKLSAYCPGHENDGGRHQRSLSISIGADGRILLHCHAGCKTEDILKASGLEMKDLYPPKEGRQVNSNGEIVATYDYVDANGAPVFQVVRYEGKKFLQRRPDPSQAGRWIWNLDGVERVLYNLPALLAAGPDEVVFVAEGEKDVDALSAIGMTVTCNSGGAMKWGNVGDDTALEGRRVVIIADKDEAGRRHAQNIASRLAGRASEIKIIEMPGDDNKDASDWLNSLDGKESDDLVDALRDMAEQAPVWRPGADTPEVEAEQFNDATAKIPEYVPFPVNALPQVFAQFVIEGAAAIGCDPVFIAVPLLVAAAAAIGNARKILLKRGWIEPLIIWAAIIGESGTAKSPAMELALRPVRIRQATALLAHEAEKRIYRDDLLQYDCALSAWKRKGGMGLPPVEPKKPVAERFYCDDITLEALGVLLRDNWRGLMLIRDELAGWLGGFDRYAQTRGGDAPKWLEVFGGRSLIIDRKRDGVLYVPRASVGVIGGIQPATLQRSLGREYFENGLAARLLLVCPPRQVKVWSEREIAPEVEQAVADVFERLYQLAPDEIDDERQPVVIPLDEMARAVWVEFYNQHAADCVALMGDLASAEAKIEGYAARFALLLHCVRCAADPDVNPDAVDADSMSRAVVLANWFSCEVRRVYAMLKESDDEKHKRDVLEVVQRYGGAITPRELMRSSGLATAEAARKALDALVASGQGVWVKEGTEGRGRPSHKFVLTIGES